MRRTTFTLGERGGSSSASFSGVTVISGELQSLQEGRTLAAFQGRRTFGSGAKTSLKKKTTKESQREERRAGRRNICHFPLDAVSAAKKQGSHCDLDPAPEIVPLESR